MHTMDGYQACGCTHGHNTYQQDSQLFQSTISICLRTELLFYRLEWAVCLNTALLWIPAKLLDGQFSNFTILLPYIWYWYYSTKSGLSTWHWKAAPTNLWWYQERDRYWYYWIVQYHQHLNPFHRIEMDSTLKTTEQQLEFNIWRFLFLTCVFSNTNILPQNHGPSDQPIHQLWGYGRSTWW